MFSRLAGNDEWNVDPSRINRLKEEYKRDRHVKQAYQSTTITNATSASIRKSLLNNGSDDMPSDQRSFSEDEQRRDRKAHKFSQVYLSL
jgi:hypothetical protein